MKRLFAFVLCLALVLGLCACGGETTDPTTPTVSSEPASEATEPVKTGIPQKDNLKVLVLGHSLAVDTGHMLALVANAEGFTGLKLATLYHSGCSLAQHVDFLSNNKREYDLYVSDSANPAPPTVTVDVTMYEALRADDWDVIVMQGGVFELGYDSTYKSGHIQTIQNYVNQNKLNPDAVFVWHMPWSFPTDPELQAMHPHTPNPFIEGYIPFGNSRSAFYEAMAQCVKDNILTNDTFVALIPSGTAVENAHSSYMGDWDLHRDYGHASDYARLMTSYVWYCVLMGIDHLDEMKQTTIPVKYFRSYTGLQDVQLSELEINIALESINNALKTPLAVTQSQYTEAPEGYVAK